MGFSLSNEFSSVIGQRIEVGINLLIKIHIIYIVYKVYFKSDYFTLIYLVPV